MKRFLIAALAFIAACAAPEPSDLILATTTSVEDSGLLETLAPAFETAHPAYALQAMAVGSGQAFELGRRGDVDVLITHAPAQEAEFVADGHGVEAVPIMHNRFVIVGPPEDPAGVRETTDAVSAFQRITAAASSFVSRGDHSGTHTRERAIWRATRTVFAPHLWSVVDQEWYIEAGLGMGDVLRLAGERGAFTLSDRATFLASRPPGIEVLLDAPADTMLHNTYVVMAVTGARNAEGAQAFVEWLRSAGAQSLIGDYRAGAATEPLFVPAIR